MIVCIRGLSVLFRRGMGVYLGGMHKEERSTYE